MDGSVSGLSVTATTVTITDDDPAGVTVSKATLTVTEQDSTGGSYTVALDSQPAANVVVTVAGHAGSEVSPNPATLTFTALNWATAQTVTVTAGNDADAIDDTVSLSHSAASSDGDYQAIAITGVTVTVSDNETVSSGVVLSVNPAMLAEGGGAKLIAVTATLNHAPRAVATALSLSVGASGDTALEGTDYATIGSLSLTIGAGASSATETFTLTPTNDDRDEDNETLTVDGSVSGLSVTATTVTITDDDPAGVTVSETALTVTEEDTTGGSYTVVLDSQPAGNVVVTVAGHAGSEVSPNPATLTFTALNWATAQTVTVTAGNDADAIDDTVSLSHSAASSDGDYQAIAITGVTVTVSDNETVSSGVVLSVNPAMLAEGGGAKLIAVTATLNHAPRNVATALSLSVGASGDTALEGTDYGTIGSLSLTIGAGASSATETFTLTPTNDDRDEDNETLTVDGSVSGLSVTATTVTITDDDPAGVTVSKATLTVTEQDSTGGSYTVVLDSQPAANVVVTVAGHAGSEVSPNPATLTFTALNWATVQTVTVTAGNDADAIDDTVSLSHSAASTDTDYQAIAIDGVTVTVSDNETVSSGVVLSVNPAMLAEGGGAKLIAVTATLNHAPRAVATALSLSVGASGDTALEGTDYATIGSLSLTIGAGASSATTTFTLTPSDDDRDEADEALTVDGSVSGLSVTATTVTITDDDPAGVTVSETALTVTEEDTTGGSYTVVLDSQPTGNVVVTVAGHAGSEVSPNPATLTFTALNWATAQTVTVTAGNDADAIDDTVSLSHSAASSDGDYQAIAITGVTVTVSDNETPVTDDDVPAVTVSYEQATYTVAEGSSVTVKVKLSADPERSVTIRITASNQGTTSNGDYSGVPTSVTIEAGETEAMFSFAAASDSDNDDGESVKFGFESPLPAGVTEGTTNETVVSITDDDVPAVTVSYEQAAYTVAEGSSVTVKVQLSADPERTVTIPINRAGQDGATAADYSGVPTSLTFNSGDTEKEISFAAATDSVDDDGESVKLTFGTLTTSVTAGTINEATVLITDGDVPAVTVSYEQATYTVAEGSSVTVKVKLSADPERSVTIRITASNQGTTSNGDYSGVPTSVTIEAGETEAMFSFAAASDSDNDDGESVKFGFESPLPAGVTEGTTNETVVSITDDDDTAVTVSYEQGTYTVAEGSTVTVKVQLSADPERTVTIPIPRVNQDGASNSDYSGVPPDVTFNSGDMERDISFAAATDSVDDDGESVKLTFGSLPAGVSPGTRNEATVSITDGDVPAVEVSYERATYTVAEGRGIAVRVKLDVDPKRTVRIRITKAGQDGATSADYSGVPASLTFNSGDTVKSIAFAATQDTVSDTGESVKLGFGSLPAGVTGGSTAETVVSIADNPITTPTPNLECNNEASKIIVLDAIGEISAAGESDFWRVELDPGRMYIIEVLGAERGLDVLGEDAYAGDLTLRDADLIARWNADRSRRLSRFSLSGNRNSIAVFKETEPAGVVQFEVQSGDGGAGTYQIKIRVNNVCRIDPVTNEVSYPWAGGPEGYTNDTPANTSSTSILYPHGRTNWISVSDFLGDNWDSAPDEDWRPMEFREGYAYTIEAWAPDDIPAKHQATELRILGIHDSNGDLIPGTSSGTGRRVSVVFEPQDTGLYYVSVGPGSGDRTGAYALSVETVASNTVDHGQSLRGAEPDPAPVEPPPAPQNLSASLNPDGSITLTWDAPDDASVTGYQVLRRRPTLGEQTLRVYVENTGTTATTFTDTAVTAGVRHTYRVKAINEAGPGPRSRFARVDP